MGKDGKRRPERENEELVTNFGPLTAKSQLARHVNKRPHFHLTLGIRGSTSLPRNFSNKSPSLGIVPLVQHDGATDVARR